MVGKILSASAMGKFDPPQRPIMVASAAYAISSGAYRQKAPKFFFPCFLSQRAQMKVELRQSLFALKGESIILDLEREIHSDFCKRSSHAKVWSPLLPFSPERVG